MLPTVTIVTEILHLSHQAAAGSWEGSWRRSHLPERPREHLSRRERRVPARGGETQRSDSGGLVSVETLTQEGQPRRFPPAGTKDTS